MSPTPGIDEHVSRITQARALLAPLIANAAEPQIEAVLRSADKELHWALWNLGQVVEHRHDQNAA